MKRRERYLLYPIIFLALVAGFISKFSLAFNLPLNSDNIQPALYYYDIASNNNYLLRGWHIASTTYLFTDVPINLTIGAIAGMSPLTIKLGALLIFVFGVLTLSIIVFRTFGPAASLLTAAGVFSASLFASNFLLHQYQHIGTIFFSFLSLLIIVLITDKEGNSRKTFHYIALFIISGAGVFSDPYYVFIFTAPIISAYIILRFFKIRPLNATILLILMLSVAAGILMQGLASIFDVHIRKLSETAPVGIISLNALRGSLYFYVRSIVALFDADAFVGEDFFLKNINLILLLVAVSGGAVATLKEKNIMRKLIIVYFLMLSVVLSAAYILKTNVMNFEEARYLIPAVYSFSVFLAITISGGYLRAGLRAMLLIVFLISSAYNSYKGIIFLKPLDPHAGLAKYLEARNLTYGYSDYWNSNIITFLTNDKVKVRPVSFWADRGLLLPYYHAIKTDWYKPFGYTGQSFLMVSSKTTESDFQALTPYAVTELFGNPAKTLRFDDMTIYVWPFNIMRKVQTVEITPDTPHTAGVIEETPDGYIIHSLTGETGNLIYGRYWSLRRGRYRVNFHLMAEGKEEIAVIGVYGIDKTTQRYTASYVRNIKGSPWWREYPIDFEVSEKESADMLYEFRVFSTGAGDVKLKGAYIE